MIWSVFEHEFKQHGSIAFGDWVLWRKSLNLWNMETDENISFNSMADVLSYELEGKTIKERIAEADLHIFDLVDEGGSGSSSPAIKISGAGSAKPKNKQRNKKPKPNYDLPVKMNTRIKTKTEDEGIRVFRQMHGKSKREHSISMDRNGFVSGYAHGNKTSVLSPVAKKGEIIVHNHPQRSYGKVSHFSKADLINTGRSNTRRGIVATFTNGYHKFEKGTHFKAEDFTRAVQNARFGKGYEGKGGYDDKVTNWLTKNQKKYGYTYTLNLDKPAQKTSTTKKKSSKTTTPKPKKTISLSWDNNTGQGGFDF